MKAAAAVLGASLLFFLGVLTGLGRHEPVPPPGVITLGPARPGAADAPRSPSSPRPTDGPDRTPDGGGGSTPTTASTVTTSSTTTSSGDGSGDPTSTTGAPGTPTTPDTDAGRGGPTSTSGSSSTTSTRPGDVERVDGEVHCSPGRGRNQPPRAGAGSCTTPGPGRTSSTSSTSSTTTSSVRDGQGGRPRR